MATIPSERLTITVLRPKQRAGWPQAKALGILVPSVPGPVSAQRSFSGQSFPRVEHLSPNTFNMQIVPVESNYLKNGGFTQLPVLVSNLLLKKTGRFFTAGGAARKTAGKVFNAFFDL